MIEINEIVLCARCGADISDLILQYGEKLWPIAPQYCATCWENVVNAQRANLEAQLEEAKRELRDVEYEICGLEDQAGELEAEITKLNKQLANLDEPPAVSKDQHRLPIADAA